MLIYHDYICTVLEWKTQWKESWKYLWLSGSQKLMYFEGCYKYLSIIAVIIEQTLFSLLRQWNFISFRTIKKAALSQNGMFYLPLLIPISSFWAKSIPISLTHYFTRLKDEYFYSTDTNSMSFLKDTENLQWRIKFLKKNSFKALCL